MLQIFRKKHWSSLNYGERAVAQAPSLVILHYTGMKDGLSALERLCDPSSEVSAHYLIEESGVLHSLVPENKRAWHAGASYWKGRSDINSASIGIELVNPGHEFGYRAFPPEQIKSLKALVKGIMKRYGISPSGVLGHSDVAPARKLDPGELFPWAELAQEGLSLWPSPVEADYRAAEDILLDSARHKELLCAFGYDPACDYDVLLEAFHRHYYPEKLEQQADIASIARLLSLIRQEHDPGQGG